MEVLTRSAVSSSPWTRPAPGVYPEHWVSRGSIVEAVVEGGGALGRCETLQRKALVGGNITPGEDMRNDCIRVVPEMAAGISRQWRCPNCARIECSRDGLLVRGTPNPILFGMTVRTSAKSGGGELIRIHGQGAGARTAANTAPSDERSRCALVKDDRRSLRETGYAGGGTVNARGLAAYLSVSVDRNGERNADALVKTDAANRRQSNKNKRNAESWESRISPYKPQPHGRYCTADSVSRHGCPFQDYGDIPVGEPTSHPHGLSVRMTRAGTI